MRPILARLCHQMISMTGFFQSLWLEGQEPSQNQVRLQRLNNYTLSRENAVLAAEFGWRASSFPAMSTARERCGAESHAGTLYLVIPQLHHHPSQRTRLQTPPFSRKSFDFSIIFSTSRIQVLSLEEPFPAPTVSNSKWLARLHSFIRVVDRLLGSWSLVNLLLLLFEVLSSPFQPRAPR